VRHHRARASAPPAFRRERARSNRAPRAAVIAPPERNIAHPPPSTALWQFVLVMLFPRKRVCNRCSCGFTTPLVSRRRAVPQRSNCAPEMLRSDSVLTHCARVMRRRVARIQPRRLLVEQERPCVHAHRTPKKSGLSKTVAKPIA
jgi:hypothetical protein